MKKTIFGIMAVLAVAACDKNDSQDNAKKIQCGDYAVIIKINEPGDQLNTVINEEEVVMQRVVSASGAKYSNDEKKLVLWNKGENWMMLTGEEEDVVECK